MSQIASIDMLDMELAKRRMTHIMHNSGLHKEHLAEWTAKLTSYEWPKNDPERMKQLISMSRTYCWRQPRACCIRSPSRRLCASRLPPTWCSEKELAQAAYPPSELAAAAAVADFYPLHGHGRRRRRMGRLDSAEHAQGGRADAAACGWRGCSAQKHRAARRLDPNRCGADRR